MQNFKTRKINSDDIKAKEYIYKYIKELQRHFDIPDKKMRSILLRVYSDLSPLHIFKRFIEKHIKKISLVLKSFYNQKRKKYGFERKINGN